jgi:hypothetical protein
MWLFALFCDNLVNYVGICFIFVTFGTLYHDKSGNPGGGVIEG